MEWNLCHEASPADQQALHAKLCGQDLSAAVRDDVACEYPGTKMTLAYTKFPPTVIPT
jgi:hypothetical protein